MRRSVDDDASAVEPIGKRLHARRVGAMQIATFSEVNVSPGK